jgi:hypothetical protein
MMRQFLDIVNQAAMAGQSAPGLNVLMHNDVEGGALPVTAPGSVVRRLIFLHIDSRQSIGDPGRLFGINAHRVPLFFADVNVHSLALLDVHGLGPGTGWGRVPTPMF